MPRVLPCGHEWAYKDIEEDFKNSRDIWREVTDEFADECLCVLPPMDWTGGKFLVMEAHSHANGDAIHCCLTTINGINYARYVPRRQAQRLVDELRLSLKKQKVLA